MRALLADYRAWKALGPGGLPDNAVGWAVTSALRLVAREATGTAVHTVDGAGAPRVAVPPRRGPRPRIGVHPIPHRQLDQLPDPATAARCAALVPALHALHPSPARRPGDPRALRIATSGFERRGEALFVDDPAAHAPWLLASRHEAGHVHRDGSLHVVLPAADAAAVLAAGWGERHPLAGVAPLGIPLGLPLGYLLVYAPRDDDELAVAAHLLACAAGFDAEPV